MRDTIDYLKGPELVIQVQNFFGVKYLKCSENIKDANCRLHKRNASDQSSTGSSETDEGFIEPKDCECCDKVDDSYEITNKFWYYLFVIATELGGRLEKKKTLPTTKRFGDVRKFNRKILSFFSQMKFSMQR